MCFSKRFSIHMLSRSWECTHLSFHLSNHIIPFYNISEHTLHLCYVNINDLPSHTLCVHNTMIERTIPKLRKKTRNWDFTAEFDDRKKIFRPTILESPDKCPSEINPYVNKQVLRGEREHHDMSLVAIVENNHTMRGATKHCSTGK